MWIFQGSRLLCLFLGLCATPVYSYYGGRGNLSPVYQWRFLEYAYDSESQKQQDIKSQNLIPNKPAPIDVDVYYNRSNGQRTVFVTSPRFQAGVPAALGTVVVDRNRPYFKPYPSWEWFKNPTECKKDRIVSVYRVMIDACDRLWVLDNGQLDADVICPPQVLAFDLRTNKLIHRYELPSDQYEPRSTFVTPVVDVLSKENQCINTFLYLADCSAYSIVVYDVKRATSWRAQHLSMYPDPDFGTYNIRGQTFELMDGVLGMAVSPHGNREGKKLYYHAMSSSSEHWVYTKDLQNQNLFVNNTNGYSQIFHTYKGRRGTQSAAEAIDAEGIMYFGLMSEIDIACFVTSEEYGRNCSSTDIVASNQETLQFASGIKVINNPQNVQELWVLTSRFQKVANDDIKDNEVNFRIQMGYTNYLKRGTRCQPHWINRSSTDYNGLPVTFPDSNKKK